MKVLDIGYHSIHNNNLIKIESLELYFLIRKPTTALTWRLWGSHLCRRVTTTVQNCFQTRYDDTQYIFNFSISIICQGLQCLYFRCGPGGAPVCVRSISEGLCVMCDAVCLMMSVCFVMLCAWKASVYLSKRINSSLLTKIFNGIS